MKKNHNFEQICSDVCIYRGDEAKQTMTEKLINNKRNFKKDKLMEKLSQQIIRSERRIKSPFQIEIFQQQQKLDDQCIEKMSSELVLSQPQKKISIDLIKKWHIDLSNLSDKGVRDLSESLKSLSSLDQLNLALYGWGYWNQNITDKSLNYLTQALLLQNQLTEFKLDLNMWAYENQSITDDGAVKLMDGISVLQNLGKLELNMKGWGEGNQGITDNTVLGLSKCLQKLGNLSEVKLILWENIGKQALKELNKTLSKMENLTKIDVKFESCHQQQPVQNENLDKKLQQIKLNAVQKRRLLFQVEGIIINMGSHLNKYMLWHVALKL